MPHGRTDIWRVRHALYGETAAAGAVPSPARLADLLGIAPGDAWAALAELERRRIVVLDHERRSVVMAHPFSGVATPWVVRAGGRRYFANCAWDTLGIAAALGTDAEIAAVYAEDGAPARLALREGVPSGDGVVHLLLPPRRWQEDFYST
jgi:hypothetical protein